MSLVWVKIYPPASVFFAAAICDMRPTSILDRHAFSDAFDFFIYLYFTKSIVVIVR